jgi:hypothetical protein
MNELRWRDYLFGLGDEVGAMIAAADSTGRVAFVTGSGFDPRAVHGLSTLAGLGLLDGASVVSVGLAPQDDSGVMADLARENGSRLAELGARHRFSTTSLPYPTSGEPRWAGVQASKSMVGALANDFDTVIVDISALPSAMFFPIIAGWLEGEGRRPEATGSLNLFALVSENAEFDKHIREEGAGDPGPIGGFGQRLLETTSGRVKIWAPVLGEGQSEQLDRIHAFLQPREICPVLPFPSRNPRRGDDLVIEYEKLLFDRAEVDTANFIYASEMHPFDVYRALVRLDERLAKALEPLGGAVVIPSVHSSKTLSLGVLLAAVERKLPVVTCPPASYALDPAYDLSRAAPDSRLACAWLTGKPYSDASNGGSL